jgi:anti-sigma regulatory factor (Ser/Thr protein kinase)
MPDTAATGRWSRAPEETTAGDAGRWSRASGPAPACYVGVFRGRPDQVALARRAVARYLAGCPVAGDAVLIASEFAANAVLHSGSRGQFFTVRCQRRVSSCRVEVEDGGGAWRPGPRDTSRPHGLDLVEALAGPGNWGVAGESAGRVVWARLAW